MDEILIEEKRYVSSKRAAKMTGYAKDYIGQLCREGRVPARLVGRGWYVLESAIQDHRFGTPEAEIPAKSEQQSASAWEAPRYEATAPEVLPAVKNHLREEAQTEEAERPIHESWKAWFDHVAESATQAVEKLVPETEPELAPVEPREATQEFEPEAGEEESVPIRTLYTLPPEDLLPHPVSYREEETEGEPIQIQRPARGFRRTIQATGMVAAALALVLAALGTGYFDTTIASNKPVGILAGIGYVEK